MERIKARLGRRGLVLAFLSIMWIMQGLIIHTSPGNRLAEQAILFEVLLDPRIRIAVWMVTGVLGLVCAFSVKTQWLGWSVMCIAPIERTISYLWSFAMWAVPDAPPGKLDSIVLAVYWACWTIIIGLLASWSEDSETKLKLSRGE